MGREVSTRTCSSTLIPCHLLECSGWHWRNYRLDYHGWEGAWHAHCTGGGRTIPMDRWGGAAAMTRLAATRTGTGDAAMTGSSGSFHAWLSERARRHSMVSSPVPREWWRYGFSSGRRQGTTERKSWALPAAGWWIVQAPPGHLS